MEAREGQNGSRGAKTKGQNKLTGLSICVKLEGPSRGSARILQKNILKAT